MKLVPKKKAVLIKPRNPKRLLKLIPTAQVITYHGEKVVAVPHRLDETRVMNNLGLDVPSPMLREYKWPRSHLIENPFEAQKITAGFLTLNSRAFVLNDLGTGKSLAALWAYDYLRRKHVADKLLIICPLSTTERTWADEIFFNLPHLSAVVLYGSRAKRLKLLAEDHDIYIINHHGASIIEEEMRERNDITHVVLDEIASVARNKQTDMWKSLNQLINRQKKYMSPSRSAWGMTATPTPNEPTDAWAQIRLLVPENVPPYFGRFRDTVMRQIGPYMWLPREDAIDTIDDVMTPAVRFRRSDCIDLPPTIYVTRTAELTKPQQKAYDTMHKDLMAQLASGDILAVNEAVKVGKLVQIACGVVYGKDEGNAKVENVIGAAPRIKVTLEAVASADSKAIVFVPYVSAIALVADAMRDAGYATAVIHGGISKHERDVTFQSFQKTKAPQVIVAQPAAMSHGLTLTAASTIIWYAPPNSAEIYEQANGRITRPGQKFTTVIVNVEGTPVERRMYSRLKNKQAMQNLLLEKKVHREVA